MKNILIAVAAAATLLTTPFFSTSAKADGHKNIIQTVQAGEHEERVIMILPDGVRAGHAYPVLIAPGDREPSNPMFFWGDEPSKLGWVIVQTPYLYGGTKAQLQDMLDGITAKLAQKDIVVEGFHAIGWSANSSSVSKNVADMPGAFASLSLIPGSGGSATARKLCKQDDMRVLFITGSRDRGWLSGAERMRDQLQGCGAEHVTFEIIKGGGHVLKEISGHQLFRMLNGNRK